MWLQVWVRLALIFLSLVRSLTRFSVRDRHFSQRALGNGEPVLYAVLCAQRWLLFSGYSAPGLLVTMVAPGAAYDAIAEILRIKGFGVVRGAHGANGRAALYEMIDLVLDGSQAVLAVDGPNAPPGTVQHGIIELARDTQAPIVPLVAACATPWHLNLSSGPCDLPKPFSRCVILEGEPLRIEPESGDVEIAAAANDLETRLQKLCREAERSVRDGERPKTARSER